MPCWSLILKMKEEWPVDVGDYEVCDPDNRVAVCTLEDNIKLPKSKVAIIGKCRTENLGVERIVLNIISNSNIRALIICGREIRGHVSGQAIMALWKNGIDKQKRIKGAKGALPYIQNLPAFFVDRFRKQIRVVDMIGITDGSAIKKEIDSILKKKPKPYVDKKINVHGYMIKPKIAETKFNVRKDTVVISPEYKLRLDVKDWKIRS